ncbi:MAG: hypothetical protein ACOC56_03515 [Atribacterota bacterium]
MAIDPKGNEVNARRIGDAIRVLNTKRKFGANREYFYTRIQLDDGEEIELLFTDHQFETARKRAEKNPEDLPNIHWLRDLLD